MSTRFRLTLCACLLFGLGSGCAQNAVLELFIKMPTAPVSGPTTFAMVQVRDAADFQFPMEFGGEDLSSMELDPVERLEDHISVVGTEESVSLNARVRFCQSARCDSIEDETNRSERWFHIERPFFLGQRTEVMLDIPAIPTESDTEEVLTVPEDMGGGLVAFCRVKGCVDGFLGGGGYCRDDGRHLCESL